MNYWLFKSEPDAFSIDDLAAMPGKKDHWDGIRNYQVRNMIRDDIKKGDLGFFYHSSCAIPGIVGQFSVTRESYPDHTAFDKKEKYFDAKSDPDNPRWLMVDVKFKKKFKEIISLEELKTKKPLQDMLLLKKGNRLSIMPITKKEWDYINKLA